MVAAAVAFAVGMSMGYADGWKQGRASYWSTIDSLPVGERMHSYGGFRLQDGKWVCCVTGSDSVSIWCVHTIQELPKKFILLMEEGERKIMELP